MSTRPVAGTSPLSLRRQVYKSLKDAVLSGDLKPGEIVSEIELARQWEISRAPIREAIRQLEQENLVRSSPRRSATVVGITAASVRDLYEVREVLESLSARLVALRATDLDLDAVEELSRGVEQTHDTDDYRSAIVVDDELHRKLANSTRNRVLETQLARVLDRLMIARMMVRQEPGRLDDIGVEHRALIVALRARDADAAAAAAALHVRNAGARLVDMLLRASVDDEG
ncbi:MAG TPA: GntR family transcriptional regulator [Candidatus Nitrosotalea sp.]|nr:GntR family transcriptional regulator [Candidatus Nitrosotalea sp.]